MIILDRFPRFDIFLWAVILACLAVPVARCQSATDVTYQFVKQPVAPLPDVTHYAVFACNHDTERQIVSGGEVYGRAMRYGINGVTRSGLLALANRTSGTSWQRRVLMGGEIALWAATGLTQLDVIKVREDIYKGLMPGGALSIRTITTAVKATEVEFKIPDDMIPPSFTVPAKDCVVFSFFGTAATWPVNPVRDDGVPR